MAVDSSIERSPLFAVHKNGIVSHRFTSDKRRRHGGTAPLCLFLLFLFFYFFFQSSVSTSRAMHRSLTAASLRQCVHGGRSGPAVANACDATAPLNQLCIRLPPLFCLSGLLCVCYASGMEDRTEALLLTQCRVHSKFGFPANLKITFSTKGNFSTGMLGRT